MKILLFSVSRNSYCSMLSWFCWSAIVVSYYMDQMLLLYFLSATHVALQVKKIYSERHSHTCMCNEAPCEH